MSSLTAAEILAHPEFPYVNWHLRPTRKERIVIGKSRGGPFRIAYEIHGTGPIHMVWIMGLGGIKSAWQRQTKDFGHDQADKYSCLVFDHRGIGESDRPIMRYSTSEMARDVIEILDHIKWNKDRSLHIIGVSMGGMVSQELALRIPERIASLTLMSTGRQIRNTVGFFENVYNRAMLFIPHHIDTSLSRIKHNLHSPSFLASPDSSEYIIEPFPTSGDRCMAIELTKRLDPSIYPKYGFMLQLVAAGWHYKSDGQLARLAALVGPGRIMVIHGTKDNMVAWELGVELAEALGEGVQVRWVEGQGHVIHVEKREELKEWIEELVEKTEKMKVDVLSEAANGTGKRVAAERNGHLNGVSR